MILFIVFAIAGWLLDNEILLWISIIFLLYIPAMVCAYCIQGTNDSYKSWKRKRKKAKHLAESKLLRCRACDIVYKREELDISQTEVPRCPQCNKKLVPAD